jgi:hypothetical protein
MKKLGFKIKKWLFNNLVKRYLVTIDATLLNLFTKEKKIGNESYFSHDKQNKEYKRIMKILDSKKYKNFFYKAVNYDRKNPEGETIKPYSQKFLDRILKGMSIGYLYLFDKKLYENIRLFKKWSGKVSTIDTQIDEYMSITSPDERVDRGIELGVINRDKGKAQKRLRKIQSSRVDKILASNRV